MQNATLRANVLFGAPWDEAWYAQVLDASGMLPPPPPVSDIGPPELEILDAPPPAMTGPPTATGPAAAPEIKFCRILAKFCRNFVKF